jgi:hypothetical protein
MPMPVSDTQDEATPASSRPMVIVPPDGVYFIALSTKIADSARV